VKLFASIAMKERLRFAIRAGGKIGGVGVVTKIKA
jgi:translation elongation factor EF-Tu-like GTPase